MLTGHNATRGVDPDKKSTGDTKMLYCTSLYAVHDDEYQTSKAGAIIESNLGDYEAFLVPFILSHPSVLSHLL